jgi:BioD-like phosphotransacetylase family protein
MMVALYITSVQRGAGKSLITLGLMDRLRRDGFKVGYFKPVGHFPIKVENTVTDEGAWLVRRLFQLEDAIEDICPVIITQDLIMKNYEKDISGLQEKTEEAFKRISADKDIVVVGTDSNFSEGSSFGLSSLQLLKALNAYVLFVESYECDFCIDFILEMKRVIGSPMVGVVFNRVEAVDLKEIKEFVSPFLYRREIEVFGSLPADALLGSMRVRDLLDHLGADVVCGKDRLNGLVENFLVGGMQVDKFITYLLKSPGSAVIVGGDRTDIQLVAIENDVRCLILSGSLYPNDTIIARAEARGVPILVAREDTYTVAKNVDGMIGRFHLSEKQKIDHGIKLVNQGFDFKKLYKHLELRLG